MRKQREFRDEQLLDHVDVPQNPQRNKLYAHESGRPSHFQLNEGHVRATGV